MADIKFLRAIGASGIPATIDLTAAGTHLLADNFKIGAAGVTASKPLKLDASKQFTSGEFFLAGIPASILLMVVIGFFVAIVWPMMGMPVLTGG